MLINSEVISDSHPELFLSDEERSSSSKTSSYGEPGTYSASSAVSAVSSLAGRAPVSPLAAGTSVMSIAGGISVTSMAGRMSVTSATEISSASTLKAPLDFLAAATAEVKIT